MAKTTDSIMYQSLTLIKDSNLVHPTLHVPKHTYTSNNRNDRNCIHFETSTLTSVELVKLAVCFYLEQRCRGCRLIRCV
jgi:hypothetical protein